MRNGWQVWLSYWNNLSYLTSIGIPIIKVRQSPDHLIFITRSPYLEGQSLNWNTVLFLLPILFSAGAGESTSISTTSLLSFLLSKGLRWRSLVDWWLRSRSFFSLPESRLLLSLSLWFLSLSDSCFLLSLSLFFLSLPLSSLSLSFLLSFSFLSDSLGFLTSVCSVDPCGVSKCRFSVVFSFNWFNSSTVFWTLTVACE